MLRSKIHVLGITILKLLLILKIGSHWSHWKAQTPGPEAYLQNFTCTLAQSVNLTALNLGTPVVYIFEVRQRNILVNSRSPSF